MSEKIYLIRRIWIDPLENRVSDAVGWQIVGYVYDVNVASELYQNGRLFTKADCWAITEPAHEFIYEEVEPWKQ
jgi:hypothetical protein